MSLREDLRTENITQFDLSHYTSVPAGTSVRDTLARLREEQNNVCLITEGNKLVGIFTSRDVVRRVMSNPSTVEGAIDAVMTANPYSIEDSASAGDVLWMMNDKGIRDLPVVTANGKVVGNASHRTVLDYLAARHNTVIVNMPPRPGQVPTQPEGGD